MSEKAAKSTLKTMEQRAYLKGQVIANLVINAVINFLIALWLYSAKPKVPLADMAFDIEITILIIGFLASWIAIVTLRKNIKAGTEYTGGGKKLPFKLPTSPALRALLIMLFMMIVYGGLILILPLALLIPSGLSNWGYIVFKTIYTGICGAIVVALAIESVFRE